ncbi:Polysaccharide deacetylase family protein [Sulfidibacter corallicola]|uniref:Polysaccharide deacetylase family protein n=1 Tax=Sulfidibacter corallicola TaxID=2818388 RepID=A0A8A4TM89_SULCO|nr:polysaccharide deacetylase family protein [Sulfidibacter corallicola]QTD50008.1 polysaccharide deacetylase family protein [Sulfidibacter corallicola]
MTSPLSRKVFDRLKGGLRYAGLLWRYQLPVFALAVLTCWYLSISFWWLAVLAPISLLASEVIRHIAQTRMFGPVIHRVETDEPMVALTFDDGPNPPYTGHLLKTLRRHGAKATFFVIGRLVEQSPETVKEILADGHQVGNHSYHHRPMIGKTPFGVASEIKRCDRLLESLGCPPGIVFRTPFAAQFLSVPFVLALQKRANIMFDVSPRDWELTNAKKIAKRVLEGVSPGSIVRLHDGGGNRSATCKAVDIIARELIKRGFRMVTVETLMAARTVPLQSAS